MLWMLFGPWSLSWWCCRFGLWWGPGVSTRDIWGWCHRCQSHLGIPGWLSCHLVGEGREHNLVIVKASSSSAPQPQPRTTSLATQPQLEKMCFFYTLIELNHSVHLGIPGQPLPGTTCPKGVSTEPATSMKKVAEVLAQCVGDLLMEHWCLNAWPKWSPGWCSQVTASPTSTFQHK